LGALGGDAVEYKSTELWYQVDRGLSVWVGFGNKESDAEAFYLAGVQERFMYQMTGEFFGAQGFDSYVELASTLSAMPDACRW
jgi:hypothetical protein